MTIANAQAVRSLPTPETMLGDGTLCPGCGIPFFTQRSPQRDPECAVATGLFIDFDGQVVLCESCIAFLAGLIGYIDPEQGKARASDVRRAQRREEKIRDAEQARSVAHEAAHDLCAALDALDEALA